MCFLIVFGKRMLQDRLTAQGAAFACWTERGRRTLSHPLYSRPEVYRWPSASSLRSPAFKQPFALRTR